MDALRARGMMVLYGMAVRPGARRTTRRSCRRSRSTSRAPGCPRTRPRARSCCQRAGDVLGWIADGSLDVRIGERYPLEDARRAHEDLEARRSTGKLILVP